MKLNIVSDLHIYGGEEYIIKPPEADVYILGGDVCTNGNSIPWILKNYPNDKPIIYVMGNHEYYNTIMSEELERSKQQANGTNITILDNDKIKIGDIWFIGATLWTDFMLFGKWHKPYSEMSAQRAINDFQYINFFPKTKLTPFHTEIMFRESKKYLIKQLIDLRYEKVVVITHHAPSRLSIAPKYKDDEVSAGFASTLLDNMVKGIEPLLWIHGHTHTYWDYVIRSTRVICNPRGNMYETINEFDPQLIIGV